MIISAPTEKLLTIAFRAIEAQKAKEETRAAKHAYHIAWQRFETGIETDDVDADYAFIVHPEERISSNHQLFNDACDATKKEHAAYKSAKRMEYNAKRRLETAIRGIK